MPTPDAPTPTLVIFKFTGTAYGVSPTDYGYYKLENERLGKTIYSTPGELAAMQAAGVVVVHYD